MGWKLQIKGKSWDQAFITTGMSRKQVKAKIKAEIERCLDNYFYEENSNVSES